MRLLTAAGLALALALVLAPGTLTQAQSPITRFEKGQTESLGGRTYRTTLSAVPVNYLNNGSWVPITNALGSTGDPAMSVGVDELIQFRIADQLAGQSPILRIGHGQAHIRIALPGANTNVQGVVNGNSIRFDEAWNGADLEYVVGGHFVKENIYLKAGHPASFSFRIDSHAGFDPATLVFGEFRILPPVLTKPGEAPVSLSWATSVVGGKTVLTVTLPAGDWSGWVLDPTTTIQPDATAGLDTWLDKGNSTDNHATSTRSQIGDRDGAGSNENRTLIEFDVSSIPSTDTVSSATLSLYEYDAADTASVGSWAAGLRRVLVDWNEAQANWDDRLTSTAWTTGGAGSDGNDRSASDSASLTLDGTAAGAFVDWTGSTLDDDVQKLVDGTYSNNYGWLLQAPTAANQGSNTAFNLFRSSDYATAADRPKLVIIHTSPAAMRSFGVIIYSVFPLGGLW